MKTIFNFARRPPSPVVSPSDAAGALSLADLPPGREATVVAVDPAAPCAQRLLDLGLLPRTRVRAVRRAPLGDPTVYELRGGRLCLRRSEASRVRVVLVDEAPRG